MADNDQAAVIAPLAHLADQANEEHRKVQAAAGTAVRHAHAAGEALNEAKDRTPHGEWMDWLPEGEGEGDAD